MKVLASKTEAKHVLNTSMWIPKHVTSPLFSLKESRVGVASYVDISILGTIFERYVQDGDGSFVVGKFIR